ncbi:hypothetical protein AVEN_244931-1 [Araneus ventricosus]|uniref:Uncharacterized protein n=1 Tax=Araneus ventricosus TaxID=182803 RepID=A0A4Y2F8B3_ARAVE|nr:hypothetical protein AVEN_244931-1 [Araneus ventricosus]
MNGVISEEWQEQLHHVEKLENSDWERDGILEEIVDELVIQIDSNGSNVDSEELVKILITSKELLPPCLSTRDQSNDSRRDSNTENEGRVLMTITGLGPIPPAEVDPVIGVDSNL